MVSVKDGGCGWEKLIIPAAPQAASRFGCGPR